MKIQHYKAVAVICIIFMGIRALAGDTTDEDYQDLDIVEFARKQYHKGTTSEGPTVSTTKGDPQILYRYAVSEALKFFNMQEMQLNLTKMHFANVWGAEDAGVRKIVAKINSMAAFLNQRINVLQDKLNRESTRSERYLLPIEYNLLDMLGKGWKEMEVFIDEKCAERNLTEAEARELSPLREWLEFSDQELALSYDDMREHMEKLFEVEEAEPFTLPTTVEQTGPFVVH